MHLRNSIRFAALVLICSAPCAGQVKPSETKPEARCRNETVLKRVERALEARAALDFKSTTLADFAHSMSDKLGVPVLLDRKALNDAGLDPQVKISFHQQPMKLATAVEFILGTNDLTWVVRNEAMLITTRDEASHFLETRVYDVADILLAESLDAGDRDPATLDRDGLQQFIQFAVGHTSWDSAGGPGSMSCIDLMLVCSQTQSIHRRIVDVLDRTRKIIAARRAGWKHAAREQYVPVIPVYASEAMQKILDTPVSLDIEQQPLGDAMEYLSDMHDVPILVEQKSLEDAGLGLDTPVSIQASNISLRSALDRLLHEYELEWQINDDALLVTTDDEAGQRIEGRVYDVIDLVVPDPSELQNPGLYAFDYDSLTDIMTSNVAPTTWSEDRSDFAPFYGMLVCVQSQRVHESVVELFEDLRAARRERATQEPLVKEQPKADPTALSTVIYKVQAPVRWRKVKKQVASIANQPGALETPPRIIEADEPDTLGYPDEKHIQEVAAALIAMVEPSSWESTGGKGAVRTVRAGPDHLASLVVRQIPAVHAEIRRFLNQLEGTGGGFGRGAHQMGGGFF